MKQPRKTEPDEKDIANIEEMMKAWPATKGDVEALKGKIEASNVRSDSDECLKSRTLEEQLNESRRAFYDSEKRAEAMLQHLDGLTYAAALSMLEKCREKLSDTIVHVEYKDKYMDSVGL